MPPQPIIPNWVRVIARLAHEGNTMMIGLDFKPNAAGPYTGVALDGLCSSIWSAIGTPLLNVLTASWQVSAIEAVDRSQVAGAYGIFLPSPNAGVMTGDSTPANCAIVISKRTGLTGRRNHGRMYIPGFSDTQVLGSTFQSTFLILLNALPVAMLAYNGTGTLPGKFAIASIRDLAMKTITAYAVDGIVDSQRRRLPGRGY